MSEGDGYWGYCFWHHEYEPDDNCYIICGECFHVYRTERELIDAFNRMQAENYREIQEYWKAHPLSPEQEELLAKVIEQELQEGYDRRAAFGDEDEPPTPVTSGENIYFCPLCAHDF